MEKGDYIVHWSGKVCKVLDVTMMDLMDKKQEYYILQPVREEKERIYVPAVKATESLRPLLTKEEALKLIEEIPHIPPLVVKDEKMREKEYKIAFYSKDYHNIVKVVKDLYQRKLLRVKSGKKPISKDMNQLSFVETAFEEEMAFALEIPRDQVKDFIIERLGDAETEVLLQS